MIRSITCPSRRVARSGIREGGEFSHVPEINNDAKLQTIAAAACLFGTGPGACASNGSRNADATKSAIGSSAIGIATQSALATDARGGVVLLHVLGERRGMGAAILPRDSARQDRAQRNQLRVAAQAREKMSVVVIEGLCRREESAAPVESRLRA